MIRSDIGLRLLAVLILAATRAAAQPAIPAATADDPYRRYIETAPEFEPVRQDERFLSGRWNTWIYMPWRYKWSIGTGDAGGRFCRTYGINGGFTDHGEGPSTGCAGGTCGSTTTTPPAKATSTCTGPTTRRASRPTSATRGPSATGSMDPGRSTRTSGNSSVAA